MGNRLLLHRGVHDQPFKLGRFDGLGCHSRIDGGLEQLLDSGLAQARAKAPDLRGVAGQARLVEGHAAEVLPDHVLGPALHQLLVAQLVGMLEVQQAGHQAQGKTGTAGGSDTGAGHLQRRAEQIVLRDGAALTHLARKVRRQGRLDLRPGQSARQHCQWVAQVDHLGQRLAKEVGAIGLGHRQNSQKSNSDLTILGGLATTRYRRNPSVHAGRWGSAGPTFYRTSR